MALSCSDGVSIVEITDGVHAKQSCLVARHVGRLHLRTAGLFDMIPIRDRRISQPDKVAIAGVRWTCCWGCILELCHAFV